MSDVDAAREYEAAAEEFANARGRTARSAARKRWDAAKSAMDARQRQVWECDDCTRLHYADHRAEAGTLDVLCRCQCYGCRAAHDVNEGACLAGADR